MADEIDVITLSNIKTLVDQIDSIRLPHIVHARIVKRSWQYTANQAEKVAKEEYGDGATNEQIAKIWGTHHFDWYLVVKIANPQLLKQDDRIAIRVVNKKRGVPRFNTKFWWLISDQTTYGPRNSYSGGASGEFDLGFPIQTFIFRFGNSSSHYMDSNTDRSLHRWMWGPIRHRVLIKAQYHDYDDYGGGGYWDYFEENCTIYSICLGRTLVGTDDSNGHPQYEYYDYKPIYLMRSRGVTL